MPTEAKDDLIWETVMAMDEQLKSAVSACCGGPTHFRMTAWRILASWLTGSSIMWK